MGQSDFEIEIRPHGPELRLCIRGELDMATAPRIQEVVPLVEEHAPKKVVLDLSQLDFIDSQGTRALIAVAERVRDRFALRVENLPPPVERVVDALGVRERLVASGA